MCMKKVSKALGTFVVTKVFIKQRTVKALSVEHALEMAEEVDEVATNKDLSNWHAHEVGE